MSAMSRYSSSMFFDTGQSPLSPNRKSICSSRVRQICLIGMLPAEQKLIAAAQKLNLPLVQSDSGEEFWHTEGVLFVTNVFEGANFNDLRMSHRIVGPEAFLQIVDVFDKISRKLAHPIYCFNLHQKKICLMGFEKQHLVYLKNLINFMGGSVRIKIQNDISYLVTNTVNSEHFTKATKFGIPIMRAQWVLELWARRDQPKVDLLDPALMRLNVTELSSLHIAFTGFSDEETKSLEARALELGASVLSVPCELCTHVVVNPDKVPAKPLPQESPDSPCFVVVFQWFNLLCRMKMEVSATKHIFHRPENLRHRNSGSLKRRISHPRSSLSDSVSDPNSNQDSVNPTDSNNLNDNADDDAIPVKTSRIQSEVQESVPDELKKTPSKLFCAEMESSPLKPISPKVKETGENIPPEKLEKMRNRRQFKCIELYDTEKNYVDILKAINKLFRIPLEKMITDNKPLLSEKEIKAIFQRFVPILEVHTKICSTLEPLINSWDHNCLMGDVFVKYSSELMKAYPQFINHMDVISQKIDEHSLANPEFHRFLKDAESNAACQRQELKDLVVWPMQRIGRLVLLLQGIFQDTPSFHPDFNPLKKAIELVEECGRLVNEDKRKTENVINRLEMFYEIENCPLELLSTKRYFVDKYVVQDVPDTEGSFKKPYTLVLLLFKEVLEICKQRSPGLKFVNSFQRKYPYKHVHMLQLRFIKHVIFVNGPKEHLRKFALVVQPSIGRSYRSIYCVQGDNVDMSDVVHKFSLLVSRCNMMSIEEVRKSMTFKEALDYLKHNSQVIATAPQASAPGSETTSEQRNETWSSQKTPEKCLLNEFRTPEKVAMSPSKGYSLGSSHKKSKLRRAFSSFLTPIHNIVSPSFSHGLKSGLSSSSVNALGLSSYSGAESVTPKDKDRKKPKSNSFAGADKQPRQQ